MLDITAVLERNMAKNRYQNYMHPSYEHEKKLVYAIQRIDREGAVKILNEINLLERANLSPKPLQSLKYSLVASCTIFTRAIIEAGVDSESAFILSDHYINLIDESDSIVKTVEIEYLMLNSFISVISTHRSYSYGPIINKTIAYIKKHIEEKPSLERVAEIVQLHPNYLATLFKQETGSTVLNFIHKERIDAIKNFLIHTNMALQDISDIFGFASSAYFSTYCKTHLGMTAREYRKDHMK
ncbi:helix-turn-helix transcriptional regulator [Paenibacillus sp. FSL P4-0184]|jgi:YesN/AraC family two-component response regulator|uniref:helix-turn-helix transcriptional regulator n=1 Tax=Paenibacillus sp. FSL P4-0184 TaxID=2921632 RepID=UPI0030F5CC7E